MFKKVDPKQIFPKMEEAIVKFWEENKTFEKSLAIRKDAPRYSFYDGPPFATGLPHYGHIVASTMKDTVPRYWTMRGFLVERKWGWDCHGLPIENIAEKELGITHKKEIEEMGVEKFNEICRSKVLEYVGEWEKSMKRFGRWADMQGAYKTMDLDFMESVWWVFKQLWDKKLIYEGYRSMYVCPRCETTLSQSEIAEGYKDIKDLSATVKFELVDPVKSSQDSDNGASEPKTFILAWTTTPWTLIGNVALAINDKIVYCKVKSQKSKVNPPAGGENSKLVEGEFYILAKDRLGEVLKNEEYEIVEEFKGKELIGKKYQPLFPYYYENFSKKEENAAPATQERSGVGRGWQIYAAPFVTTEEGTGVVHIAPAFGEDDLNLGKEKNLPFIQHLGMDGIIKKEAGEFAGISVKPVEDYQKTDVEVIKFLAKKNLLFAKEKYLHSYPHCWRCETPLINYATSSWFVSITKIKEKMLELAENIRWTPEHIKKGRFGNWLSGARDWSISRQRYWASVMPIWKCEKCKEIKVIGSVKELEDLSGEKITDIHKHIVDKINFPCSKCKGIMKRIPDVLDTWFDSGSMPYAQMHYPFENKEKFAVGFPAEFIAEGIDQTRCWFYYLHAIASAIKDSAAFKNVIVNGIVLAEDGKKMSKRLKNYPDPEVIFQKYGADALRFYLLSSPVMSAENLNFKESEVAELVRGIFRMLWNSYSFFVLYANIDKFKVPMPTGRQENSNFKKTDNLLDKWIISELNLLIREINKGMENYDLNRTIRLFPKFIDNLSNWYIRRSRKRFWKSENDTDKNSAYQTLHYVLVELSKLMAPFTPFIAEEIYKNLTGKESVHLADFPKADEKLIDEKLNKNMADTRDLISIALQYRADKKIKVRQPLAKLSFKNFDVKEEFFDIIKEEVNVKEVVKDDSILAGSVASVISRIVVLDTDLTEDLKLEGQAREIIRFIQEMRKEAGYEVDNHIKVCYDGMAEVFQKFKDLIGKEVLSNSLDKAKMDDADLTKEFQIEDKKAIISIKKI